ncbi:hypothetical protein [Burkholderia pseudomallei]|uniref:hypothetical protein n=1 Tax=Burkholderia pseudomallei TaxID=28450 RepID=UPI0005381088|nr:hypothetical protein [Burkholderia pseudomallei]KGW11386.1 hypothetical protein X980_2656 [Burkholderia pseudomallei MSHR4000]
MLKSPEKEALARPATTDRQPRCPNFSPRRKTDPDHPDAIWHAMLACIREGAGYLLCSVLAFGALYALIRVCPPAAWPDLGWPDLGVFFSIVLLSFAIGLLSFAIVCVVGSCICAVNLLSLVFEQFLQDLRTIRRYLNGEPAHTKDEGI